MSCRRGAPNRFLAPALLLGLVAASPAPAQESAAPGRVLQVGPTRAYATPSEAAAEVRDGDRVEIDAGVYPGDVAVWRANRITLRGVGNGRAHLRADGNAAEGKAIWVIKGDNVKVENIEFSGAEVRDRNGAGIRQEGKNLTVRNSYFHHNENGILAGDHPTSKIVIEYSIFENNGHGDGRTHNVYVNEVKRLIFRYSWSHGARVGHNLKSRARRTDVLYSRLGDEDDGNASYAIDLANGGVAFVIGNVIHQGPEAENSTIVSYAAEGFERKRNRLYFVHNTVVNDRSSGTFLAVRESLKQVSILNNLFVGAGDLDEERRWKVAGNLTSIGDPGFVDAAAFDYRLVAGADPINAGKRVRGRLKAKFEYDHEADRDRRRDRARPDAGAYAR